MINKHIFYINIFVDSCESHGARGITAAVDTTRALSEQLQQKYKIKIFMTDQMVREQTGSLSYELFMNRKKCTPEIKNVITNNPDLFYFPQDQSYVSQRFFGALRKLIVFRNPARLTEVDLLDMPLLQKEYEKICTQKYNSGYRAIPPAQRDPQERYLAERDDAADADMLAHSVYTALMYPERDFLQLIITRDLGLVQATWRLKNDLLGQDLSPPGHDRLRGTSIDYRLLKDPIVRQYYRDVTSHNLMIGCTGYKQLTQLRDRVQEDPAFFDTFVTAVRAAQQAEKSLLHGMFVGAVAQTAQMAR